MESDPAWNSGMSRFTDHRAERSALLRHDPRPLVRTAEVSIRENSPLRGEPCGSLARRLQEEIEGIRDRVTISSWSLPGTTIRHETYNRNGNLTSTVYPPVSTIPADCARTIRRQVTLVMVRIADCR